MRIHRVWPRNFEFFNQNISKANYLPFGRPRSKIRSVFDFCTSRIQKTYEMAWEISISFTGSNNQFQNYESEFSWILWQVFIIGKQSDRLREFGKFQKQQFCWIRKAKFLLKMAISIMVVYMCSSLIQLAPGSRDLS